MSDNHDGPSLVNRRFQDIALPFVIIFSLGVLGFVLLQLSRNDWKEDRFAIYLLLLIPITWMAFAGLIVSVKLPFIGGWQFARHVEQVHADLDRRVTQTNARID